MGGRREKRKQSKTKRRQERLRYRMQLLKHPMPSIPPLPQFRRRNVEEEREAEDASIRVDTDFALQRLGGKPIVSFEIEVHAGDEISTRSSRGWEVAPGLIVHPGYADEGEEPAGEQDWIDSLKQRTVEGWKLTHKPSGLLALKSPAIDALLKVASDLAAVADWTAPADELRKNEEARRICNGFRHMHGAL